MHSEKSFSPSSYLSHQILSSDQVSYVHVFWNAVEPQPGEFNEETLQQYIERCQQLQQEGKQVCVTLFNGNDPVWFTKEGGFMSVSGVPSFQRYLKKVITALSAIIDLWQPFREIPVLTDNSIGIIRETRSKILQGNLALCQLTAYTEIHRQLGYTYTTPEGEIKNIAVLTPPGCSMDGWLQSNFSIRKFGNNHSEDSLLDDSSIVTIQ